MLLKDVILTGKILSEALTALKKFSGETFVIKLGGPALGNIEQIKSFASQLVLLKQCGIDIIIVHGAGPKLGQILEKLNVKSSFVNDIRISTKENIDVVEMILSGHINKQIVSAINEAGGLALGFSGKDVKLMTASKVRKTYKETDSNIERILDFGYVGIPKKINSEIFQILEDSNIIPVISPVGFDEFNNTYNVNADNVASAIAASLQAQKLILLTEYDGIYNKNKKLLKKLTLEEAESIAKLRGTKEYILQKLNFCIEALKNGVQKAHLINMNTPYCILLEILGSEGIGTSITADDNPVYVDAFDFEG